MSLENVTTIEISVMEAQAAIAVAAAERLVSPARRLYVFGGADGTFPYYATFSAAITAANALTPAPSTTNPVSIVLLSNTNGTPVEISGADDWYALCLDGIYVSSPYREIFSTTTLPTTLPKGMRVLYRSGGNETLYVGNDSGVAQAVGIQAVTSVAGKTGAVTLVKADVGLGNVDNTSDLNKPISTATQTALNNIPLVFMARMLVTSAGVLSVQSLKKNTTASTPTLSRIGAGEYKVVLSSSYGNVNRGHGTVETFATSLGPTTPYIIQGQFEASSFPDLSPQFRFSIRNATSPFAFTDPDANLQFDLMILFYAS